MTTDHSLSLGLIGGVLFAVWAIAFVVMTERVQGGLLNGARAIEETAVR